MKAKTTGRTVTGVPFPWDPAGNLVQQLAGGIRQAIADGRWKPGDRLPTAKVFQSALGTGAWVPRTALRMLADEGTIVLKTHIGATVAPPKKAWRGRIAFVTPSIRECYYENRHSFVLQELFERAGWQLVHIPIDDRRPEKEMLTPLLRWIDAGLDFAICWIATPPIARGLESARIPYLVEAGLGRRYNNALTVIDPDECAIADGFRKLTHVWQKANVKSVLIVDYEREMPREPLATLASAGISFQRLMLPRSKNAHGIRTVQHGGMNLVAKFFSNPRNLKRPPNAIFFYDDYLANGGLTALAATGLRVPEDIRVATIAIRDVGPVWFKPLTRLEFDPVAAARPIAQYTLAILEGHHPSPPVLHHLTFIQGKT